MYQITSSFQKNDIYIFFVKKIIYILILTLNLYFAIEYITYFTVKQFVALHLPKIRKLSKYRMIQNKISFVDVMPPYLAVIQFTPWRK